MSHREAVLSVLYLRRIFMTDRKNSDDTLMNALTNSSTLVPCTGNSSTLWLT